MVSSICFAFFNHGQFSDIEEVIYTPPNKKVITEPDNLQDIIRNDYRHKHTGWMHEKEWRVVRRSDEKYISYLPEDLACVIIDKTRIDFALYRRLKKCLPKTIPIMTVITGCFSTRLRIIDVQYEMTYDGSEPPYIDSEDELFEYLIQRRKLV